jgi:phosphate starvation-inducible PhoH-like protein
MGCVGRGPCDRQKIVPTRSGAINCPNIVAFLHRGSPLPYGTRDGASVAREARVTDEKTVRILFDDQGLFQLLRGPNDEHFRLLNKRLGAQIVVRGNECSIRGDAFAVDLAESVIRQLEVVLRRGHPVYAQDVARAVEILSSDRSATLESVWLDTVVISGARTKISPKNANQKRYVDAVRTNTITFGVGPAGTGKTYLAMAMAVAALLKNDVKRIVLTRPAVEAGEKLGFLPGDLAEKVDPYLRPLYDALNDMMDIERGRKLIERGIIEVAPLAFMRGRTLNDSFVILDEAQNTTPEQMRMFLTRLGYNSKATVSGDITQTDLEPGRMSGLEHAVSILDGVDGIGVVRFTERDVVRHPLVQRIVEAYGRDDEHRRRPNTQLFARGGRRPAFDERPHADRDPEQTT